LERILFRKASGCSLAARHLSQDLARDNSKVSLTALRWCDGARDRDDVRLGAERGSYDPKRKYKWDRLIVRDYFCSRCHDPSHSSPGGFAIRPSTRLMNVEDGPSLGTDSSAAAKARCASSQFRAL